LQSCIQGTVYISFSRIDKEYLLIVKDDGISKPDDFSNPKGTGIGIDVIRRLVEKQFDGTIDISHTKGTAVTIRFPDNPD